MMRIPRYREYLSTGNMRTNKVNKRNQRKASPQIH